MKITYDPDADASYIQLVDVIAEGGVSESIHSIMTPKKRGEILLDFDAEGRLLGVEILNARDVLPEEVMQRASIIGHTS